MIIRLMTAQDATPVAALSDQLGYPTTPERIQERFIAIAANLDNAFFVAEYDRAVVGWVHVYGVHLLESPASFAEIGGLVVAVDARRKGIGRSLMGSAEGWAMTHGYPDVRLRSGLHRTDAHQFYQRIGYELIKTNYSFRKMLL